MNTRQINLTRFNKTLLSIILVSILLYLGKTFLIPVAIAALLGMLLYPVAHKLEQFNLKRPTAALFSILLLLLILSIIGTLAYFQIKELESDLPRLEEKIEEKANSFQWTFYQKTDISKNEQEEIIEENRPDILASVSEFLKDLVLDGLYLLLVFFIVLAYTFFFLIYRRKIKNFFIKLKLFDDQKEAYSMLSRISEIAYYYLKGVLTVISIMAVIYTLGFWVIGIQHALLFAIITALLRIIPYFGPFLGFALVLVFTFITKDPMWFLLLVLTFFVVTQLVEAYLLTPNITGPKVKINPMATLMGILLGNLIWGVPGMILFVPLFGILKVIFDQVPKLNPLGYILGKEESS